MQLNYSLTFLIKLSLCHIIIIKKKQVGTCWTLGGDNPIIVSCGGNLCLGWIRCFFNNILHQKKTIYQNTTHSKLFIKILHPYDKKKFLLSRGIGNPTTHLLKLKKKMGRVVANPATQYTAWEAELPRQTCLSFVLFCFFFN